MPSITLPAACIYSTGKAYIGVQIHAALYQMAAGSSESPRFFKTDITSILQEKNEFKYRVIELEEEVEYLRK